ERRRPLPEDRAIPTQDPADAARQTARVALAVLPPAARAFLEALHAGHFPAPPGRPAYRLEALLGHLAGGGRHGFGGEGLAVAVAAGGVPGGRAGGGGAGETTEQGGLAGGVGSMPGFHQRKVVADGRERV